MRKVDIYTDGACDAKGQGGWGFVLRYESIALYRSFGWANKTTNNRMELTAVIKGLDTLKEPCEVNVYTDSQYISSAFNDGFIYKWHNDLFVHTSNADLWKHLLKAMENHNVTFTKIPAHTGDRYNEMADTLAKQGLEQAYNARNISSR